MPCLIYRQCASDRYTLPCTDRHEYGGPVLPCPVVSKHVLTASILAAVMYTHRIPNYRSCRQKIHWRRRSWNWKQSAPPLRSSSESSLPSTALYPSAIHPPFIHDAVHFEAFVYLLYATTCCSWVLFSKTPIQHVARQELCSARFVVLMQLTCSDSNASFEYLRRGQLRATGLWWLRSCTCMCALSKGAARILYIVGTRDSQSHCHFIPLMT